MTVEIAVVGSINMDLAVTTPRVPLTGENLLAHGLVVGLGGKGANPAVALSRMGARSALVGCVGDDAFGQQARELLRGENVDDAAVRPVGETPTGVALIMVDDAGENTILVVIGANAALISEDVESALRSRRQRLDALMVSFEIPEPCVAATVSFATESGIPVVVDAGPPREYTLETWGSATILSPNALEASTLVGYTVDDVGSARRAARDLLRAGPGSVVIKLGAMGALLSTSEGDALVPGFEVDIVDTTGAGDAFTAALTLAFAEGRELEEAVRFANAAGALTVTRMGTMTAMPTRSEVEGFLAKRGG